MNALYFLPAYESEKFEKIKTKLQEIVRVQTVDLEDESKSYPENFITDFPKLIFVPTIYNNKNAFSYQGVELAIRWYLHVIREKKDLNFKIILLGAEEKATFFQNCDLSCFLKCPNVEYLQNNLDNVSKYLTVHQEKEINLNEALTTLPKIGIQPPTSYKTHHSIANEWSILRWAQALQLNIEEEHTLKSIEKTIDNLLYFNYLKAIFPVKNALSLNKILLQTGKILLIDDEVNKGWDVIFRNICKNKDYTSFGSEFKNWNTEKIIDDSFEKAKNYDVIILDLRLNDNDFDEKSLEKISGFQILKKIKEHNKGIQVIIFSATNKIWNLEALQAAGADGFIMKESPENSVDENFTKESIKNIIDTIDSCLEMKFLKNFYIDFEAVKEKLNAKVKNKLLPKEFVKETLKWYELSINLINRKLKQEDLISTYLIYFTIIENISNYVIETENPIKVSDDYYEFQFRKNYKKLSFFKEDEQKSGIYIKQNTAYKSRNKSISWVIKIYNTIDFIGKNELKIDEINHLIKKRNDIIHANSTIHGEIKINKEDIIKLNKVIFEGLINID